MTPLVLEMEPADIHLSDEQFYRLCQVNRDVRLERTAEEKLIIMPPPGRETGNRNFFHESFEIAMDVKTLGRKGRSHSAEQLIGQRCATVLM